MLNQGHEWLIKATYGNDCRERVSSVLGGFYTSAAESLWLHLRESFDQGPNPQPVIEVVHSPVSRPTMFRHGQHEILVYDQHLGQIFNRLTSLTIEDASAQAVEQYVYKLYAQRALVVGRFRTAALFGLMAKFLRGRIDPTPENPGCLARRSQLVAAQETFVIGHELVHTCLSRDKSGAGERISWYTDLMRLTHKAPFYHVDFPHLSDRRAMAEAFDDEYEESMRSALRRRGIPDSDLPLPRVRDPAETELLLNTREHMAEVVTSQPELLEECCCDAFAFIGALKTLTRHGHNPTVVASGALMALYHLRLIQFLDRIVAGQLDAPGIYSLTDFFAQATARASMLRIFILAILNVGGKTSAAKTTHEELTRLTETHATVVFSQVLHCMDFTGAESWLQQAPEVAESARDFETDRHALKRLLGFMQDGGDREESV
jgi:hypothetical protein